MAKFRVLGSPKVPILEIKQAVAADLAKNNSDEAVKLVIGKMKPIVQEHYDNAVRQVSLKLKGLGIPAGVTSAGPRTITYGKLGGGTGTFKTRNWPALSDKYRKAKPASYKFWKKTGILSHAFDTFARGPFKTYLEERKSKRNHHKNRINTTVIVGVEPLPFPFETGVSIPFVKGHDRDPMRDLSQSIDRDGLGRARFAEQSGKGTGRPFLRKLSAYLGKQMRTDITKKLRKL